MAHHELACTPDTVHWGTFSAALKPKLRIKSGDRVTMHCISGGPEIFPAPPGLEVLPEYEAIHAKVPRGPGPHILTGPIHIEGAMPGDTLEVRILEVKLRTNWGYNSIRPLRGTLPEDFPTLKMMHIPIDREKMVAELPWGTKVPLDPFFGIMGVAPPPAYGVIGSAWHTDGDRMIYEATVPANSSAVVTLPVPATEVRSSGDSPAPATGGPAEFTRELPAGTYQFSFPRRLLPGVD